MKKRQPRRSNQEIRKKGAGNGPNGANQLQEGGGANEQGQPQQQQQLSQQQQTSLEHHQSQQIIEDEGDGSHPVSIQITVDALFDTASSGQQQQQQQTSITALTTETLLQSQQLQQQIPSTTTPTQGKKKIGPSGFPFFTYNLGRDTFKSESPTQGKLSYSQTHTLTIDDNAAKTFAQPFQFLFYYNDPFPARGQQQTQCPTSLATGNVARPSSSHSSISSDQQSNATSNLNIGPPTQGTTTATTVNPNPNPANSPVQQSHPSTASLFGIGRPSTQKHKKTEGPFSLFVDLSPLFVDVPVSVHFDNSMLDSEAPPRTVQLNIRIAVAQSSPSPFLSPIQKRRFNPLMIRLSSASKLPLRPCGSYAALDRQFAPVYARFRVVSLQQWITTPKRHHSEKIKFDHVKVILAGLLDQDSLAEWFESTPLVIEIHDRERLPSTLPVANPQQQQQQQQQQTHPKEVDTTKQTANATTNPNDEKQNQQQLALDQDKLPNLRKGAASRRGKRGPSSGKPEKATEQQSTTTIITENVEHLPSISKANEPEKQQSTTKDTQPPSQQQAQPVTNNATAEETTNNKAPQSRKGKKKPPSTITEPPIQLLAASPTTAQPLPVSPRVNKQQQQQQQPIVLQQAIPNLPSTSFGIARVSLSNIIIDGDTDFKVVSQIVPSNEQGQELAAPYLECHSEISLSIKLHSPLRISKEVHKIARAVFILPSSKEADQLLEIVNSLNGGVPGKPYPVCQENTSAPLIQMQSNPTKQSSSSPSSSPVLQATQDVRGISGLLLTDKSEFWLCILEGIAEKDMTNFESKIPIEWRQEDSQVVALSNPRLRFRHQLYANCSEIRRIAVPINFQQLAISSANLPPKDVQEVLIQVGMLAKAKRLFEAKILNLFPTLSSLYSLEKHFTTTTPSQKP